MRRMLWTTLLSLSLSACYESPSDLLGANANTIVRIEPVFSFSNQAYYALGSGKTVQLCSLKSRLDLTSPCKLQGTMSVERTSHGNYIVQILSGKTYNYGLWFRSDESPQGKAGFLCFVWLGDGVVGQTDMSAVWLKYARTEVFAKLSSGVRQVATEAPINRQQLLRIASIYENTLSPLGSDTVSCIGERLWIEAKSVEIAGDNRHLQQFVPGPTPPR